MIIKIIGKSKLSMSSYGILFAEQMNKRIRELEAESERTMNNKRVKQFSELISKVNKGDTIVWDDKYNLMFNLKDVKRLKNV